MTYDDEDMNKEEEFIEWGLAFGGDMEDAKFRYNMIATEVQREIVEVVSASKNSFRNLLLQSRGSYDDAVGPIGRIRGFVVLNAIAVLVERKVKIINAVVWVNDAIGDEFEVEYVPEEKLITKKRVEIFWEHGLIDDNTRATILEGFNFGISSVMRISKGNIVKNKPISHSMTATSRLEDRFRLVKKRLPRSVRLAKVVQVDWSDNSIKWQCLDSRETGWCRMDGVVITNSTRAGEPDDDDESGENPFDKMFW